jgi:hypothetical protein
MIRPENDGNPARAPSRGGPQLGFTIHGPVEISFHVR